MFTAHSLPPVHIKMIRELPLWTTTGVPLGRIVYVGRLNSAENIFLKGVRTIYMHKVIMHRKEDPLPIRSISK